MVILITACWIILDPLKDSYYSSLKNIYYGSLIVAQVFTLTVVLSGVYFYCSFLKLKNESLKL